MPRLVSTVTCAALGLAAFATPAAADSISFGDYFSYGDNLANGFSSLTDNGVAYHVTGPGSGFQVLGEGVPNFDWNGEFKGGVFVLYDGVASGPVTISFDSALSSFTGFAAQPKAFGPYTATLIAYDGTTQVGSSVYASANFGGPTGTIPYFSVSAPAITSVVISTSNDGMGIGLGSDNAGIPEPTAWALMTIGLACLGAALRPRRGLAAASR